MTIGLNLPTVPWEIIHPTALIHKHTNTQIVRYEFAAHYRKELELSTTECQLVANVENDVSHWSETLNNECQVWAIV